MKKQIVAVLGLAVLATPAFATKARLQALGEDVNGSFYINDNRNIFLNAAQINNHKDLVTFEWGGNVTSDSAETPRGEGGVYKQMGNLAWGLHLGGASNTANAVRAGAGLVSANGVATENNNIEVFVGGDAGLKWGGSLAYAKTSQEDSPLTAESMRAKLGVIAGDTQAYANINLINNAKSGSVVTGSESGSNLGSTAKLEGKLGYQIGAIHQWNGYSLFADYRSFDAESIWGSGAKEDIGLSQLQVGAGRVTKINDRTNLFTRLSYVTGKVENDHGDISVPVAGNRCSSLRATFCKEYETSRVPVVVGVETEAASWLTLRASITQVVWGDEEVGSTKSSITNSTAVNAGASLKFGDLTLDGVIGNSTGGTIGENTGSGDGSLRTDTLMTRVGMNYRF
jgi:hypothetical protein